MTRDRGQSTVEFVLLFPLVIIVLLGLVQSGIFVRDQLQVTAAAREGAREAAVTQDRARVVSAVARSMSGHSPETSVDWGMRAGDPVTVVVRAQITELPLVGLIVRGRTVSAKAVMRMEVGR